MTTVPKPKKPSPPQILPILQKKNVQYKDGHIEMAQMHPGRNGVHQAMYGERG